MGKVRLSLKHLAHGIKLVSSWAEIHTQASQGLKPVVLTTVQPPHDVIQRSCVGVLHHILYSALCLAIFCSPLPTSPKLVLYTPCLAWAIVFVGIQQIFVE